MEDWISVLLFLSLPIFNSGSFLDTACITPNPLGNPSNDTIFIGVVVYNGRDTFRSYRRAATTKKFDSHSYPTLGNTSCNTSTVADTNASRSCGFYSYIHIISKFEREPLINGDEVVLTRSYKKARVQNDLRYGVFQCIASQQEHSSISTVTIMPEAADFKPPAFTITANLDERVTLKMLASDSNSTQQVRWRYSWGSVTRELSEWEGNTTPVIEKVNTSDAGVYEAYTTSSTDSGYVRLIVRGCRYNLWGSPSCQWTCPVCYNGGICDDVSGGCVCPPGFTGGQCEQACPSGYIGRRCGISCVTVIGVADCRGVEICLPHPFGCSCAPGFTGLDCQTVCDQGAYGAGCTEVCHCQSMSQCDSKTGLCSESGCERSWKGPMCQAKIFDVVGYGRPAAFQIGDSFTVEGLTTLDMDTSVKLLIGRELDTGTGKTGSGMSHENANLTTMPSTSGLPAGTLQFTANGGHNSRLTLETMSSHYSHLGVYYVELINGKRRQHTQILRQANNNDAVQPERFTWSVGTGESVTMTVSYYGYVSYLRWRHNGREIPSANGNTELTINYARKADEGVYECFPVNRDQSYKGLMILKVRACPSGFWGIYCNNTCPVCYYQGICHEETGQCICQPGYHGDNCSQVCDDRSNAIGMTCDLNCTTRPELRNKCLYKQVCSPHPVGCHCRAGFGSVPKCNTECQHPFFGADCAMRAHCWLTNHDAVSGCNASPCNQHYEGPGCQQLASYKGCPDGHHGRLCNYICHCADSINCRRWTGSCYSGECAEGWGGSNCQDALPALFDAPSVTFVEGGIQVSWNHWRPGYDYGTGLVDSYRVNFGLTNILTEQQEITHEDTNNNYLTYTGLNLVGKYSISVSVIKIIQDEKTVGQSSPSVVVCLSTTPPTNVNAEPTRAEERISFTVSWEDICPSTEFTYDVFFRPATRGWSDSVETFGRSVTITNDLPQCTEYLVSVRRNAEGSSRDRSAETTVLTDSEDPTAMPRDVRATLIRGINPVQILVSWTPVDVTKLNLKCDPRTTDYTYEVYYEDAGNGNETVITTTNSSTNVTISDGTLSQCTEYLISVGIKNAVGRVNRTSPVTVRTDSEDPTVAIYGVTAQKTGRVDQLQVSWSTNSINQNNLKCMPYTRYTYEVHYHPTDETIAQNISTTGSQRSLTISNLQTCTEYMISVRIRNAVGRKSRATDPIIVRTKSEAPSIKPRDVRAQRGRMLGTGPQITVTWTVDAITSGNLKCDPTTTEYSFIVYYQETSGWTQHSKEIPRRHSMGTTITERLSQCTNYSISVSVRNAAGIEGNKSSNTYIQTDSEDPTVWLSEVTARKTGRVDQLQLSWSSSNINRDNLQCNPDTGYTYVINYHPTDETRAQNISSRGSQRSLTISNLQQCTEYSISVSIRNAVGRKSRATYPTVVRTKSDAPSITPRDVRAQRVPLVGTRPQIAVTWTVDAITSGNLKCDPTTTEYSFVVYYQEMSGGTQGSKVIPGRHSMDTIISEGLRQCTYYSISVSVRNAAGIEGNKSSDIYIQTDSEDPTVAISDVTAQKTGRVDQLQVSWSASSIYKYYLKCYPSTGYTFEVYYNATYETRAQNISTTGSQTSLTISDLQQCTVYSISVSIRNAVGRKGRATEPITVRTKSEAPSIIPRDVRAQRGPMLRTMPQIAVTWTVDAITSENLKCDPTTTEYSFVVYYQEASGGTQRSKLISGKHSMDTTITERLRQCTNYSISVSVRNAAEIEGSHNSNTYIQTDSEDPSTVFRFTTTRLLGVQPSPQVRVSWPGNRLSTYDLRCDPSLGYTVIISYWPKGEGGVLVKEVDNAVENVNISGLKACTYYKIAMDVRNFIGHESNNQQLAKEVLTDSEDPTTRIEFNVSRINDTNSGQIQVTWTTDAVSFQNLKCDPSLGYDVILRYGESTGNLQKEFVTAEGINRHTLSNLLMCTEYAVSVVIRNIVDRESQNNVKKHVITDSEDVKVTPTNVYTSDVSQTSIELSWQPPESLDYTSMGCHPKYPYKYEISYRSQNFSSVTTILDQSQQEYKFTDLEPGSSYIFYLRLTNYAGRSGPYAVIECNTTVTADVLPFVLGVTFPSVFLIISLLVLVVYLITSPSRSNQCWAIRRGRIQDDNGFIEEEHSEMRTFERDQQIPNVCSSRGKTIHRHELPSYVKEQHLKEGGFHDEYKELIQGKYTSCSVAEAKINERKNRFKNVLTYDHSRVVLPLINGDSSSDYINASYIHGYKKQNAFIACQSPNKASLHDFWRMIWHEKCTKIIMVALPVENGKMKCLTYWLDTDSAPQQYSNISIERTGETASINLMIRHFKLQLGSRIHEVTQYHYFGRPDMKVPQSADILWDIIDEVEKDEDENSPPIVVHCSAGCGWTGTVIALASLRKMMKQEEAIDVFNFVNNMRKQRPLMVQVVEQYQFIFESLLINSYVGKPSTPVDDFHVNLRKWKAVTSLHKQTGLQRQFNMLSFVSPFPEDSENQVGLLSENIVKNRYPVIIPRNKFRPTLVTFVEDKTATDYINASFCDGYSKKDLFISTQLPLPNTILDFWRMVIDYKVATIVTFEAHQTWLNYLPSEGAYQYGPFSVRVMELTQEDDITTRVLRISMDHSTYQNGKGLRMWITNISLSSPSLSSFVSLIEKTQAVQRQNENRRIVVQCLDGVSQCGMFMAVYNCCTGINVDKVIDLFTMVRKLRERRPEMVGTLEQYEFCTQAISKRLSTSSVYANE